MNRGVPSSLTDMETLSSVVLTSLQEALDTSERLQSMLEHELNAALIQVCHGQIFDLLEVKMFREGPDDFYTLARPVNVVLFDIVRTHV